MANKYEILLQCIGFEWDKYNSDKIWLKHHVSQSECEQLFFNQPLLVTEDAKHSEKEIRFYALGHTDATRLLFVVFTIRKDKIRTILARDMNRKERKEYESYEKKSTKI